jgi:HK97 gp10 family phage protein
VAEIKFEGIVKLNKGLKKRMDMSAVKTVVKKNGADMQRKAQRNAPVDTGTLKRRIGLNISDSGMTATVEPTAEYAPYVELGTRFMEAQPYLKPAFEEQKKQFEKDLQKLVR